jgi:hypothetical protein
MSTNNVYPRSKLAPGLVRRILKTAANRGVMSVSLTGGEPLLYADEVLGLLAHARELGIRYTRTGTNGFVFCRHEAHDFPGRMARLASGLLKAQVHTFWISLDSADSSIHEQGRGLPGAVEGIRRALPVLHAHSLYPAVNLGINRAMGRVPIEPLSDPKLFAAQTREALRDFYRAAIGLGFTIANVCYPMNLDSADEAVAYRATSAAELVRFTVAERSILFAVLAQVTREFRSLIRIFTPLSSLEALAAQHGLSRRVAPCRGGVDFFYVAAADGLLYPCGFRGTEPLGDPTEPSAWAKRSRAGCLRCDWECFRDPSHLMAPLSDLFRRPDHSLRWVVKDRRSLRTWRDDLRYYSARGYFAMNSLYRPERLSDFS